jgi:hypothetical protein
VHLAIDPKTQRDFGCFSCLWTMGPRSHGRKGCNRTQVAADANVPHMTGSRGIVAQSGAGLTPILTPIPATNVNGGDSGERLEWRKMPHLEIARTLVNPGEHAQIRRGIDS